jgi:hypothetical protein
MDVTIFDSHPDVTIAGNTFRNVPTILQFEETPLLQVGRFVDAGFTTRFPVYHSDGTKIAVVDGSRIFLTEEGKAAQLALRHEQNLTVCELEGKPILELWREGAAALRGKAELYAPRGVLVQADDSAQAFDKGTHLEAHGIIMQGNVIENAPIGVLITRNGVSMGASRFVQE